MSGQATGLKVLTVSLSKCGGALQGSGEKFSANPVTSSRNVALPSAVTPGRDGFGPSRALPYDSSSG